jgi:hypothetical protein
MNWGFALLLALDAAVGIAIFVGRNWLKASIEKSVQNRFDSKLEILRTELRKSEEAFKQQLQSKETEISSLRDAVMTAMSSRRGVMDKRRLEAVDRLWAAFIALSPYYVVSNYMCHINIETASKEVSTNSNMRKFFEFLGSSTKSVKLPDPPSKTEQLFVSPMAWAYFSAYQTVVMLAFALAKALESGIQDISKLIKFEAVSSMLEAALPHHATLIETEGFSAYHGLLDELETNLVEALRQTLDGEDLDQANILRAAEIIRMAKNASPEPSAAPLPSRRA